MYVIIIMFCYLNLIYGHFSYHFAAIYTNVSGHVLYEKNQERQIGVDSLVAARQKNNSCYFATKLVLNRKSMSFMSLSI